MDKQAKREAIRKRQRNITIFTIVFLIIIVPIAFVSVFVPEYKVYCYAAIAVVTVVAYFVLVRLLRAPVK